VFSLEIRNLVSILSSKSYVSDKPRELLDVVQFKMTLFLETRNLVFILSSKSRVFDQSRELADAVQFKLRVFFGNAEFNSN
jgi:hypothetical protein